MRKVTLNCKIEMAHQNIACCSNENCTNVIYTEQEIVLNRKRKSKLVTIDLTLWWRWWRGL